MRSPWKQPVYPTPHADIVCADCGLKGCWIPVKHGFSRSQDRRLRAQTVDLVPQTDQASPADD